MLTTLVESGSYMKNGSTYIFAKAPIKLKFNMADDLNDSSAAAGLQIFLCVNEETFTYAITEKFRVVDGPVLTSLIFFGFTLLIVFFVTFGISYEVTNLIFRPLKALMRKLRSAENQNTDVDTDTKIQEGSKNNK
jgi:hypothetical protein